LFVYLCVRGIDVGHAFVVSEGYRCSSCICVLEVLMLVAYLGVRDIEVSGVFVCKGYRCWSCICVLGISMLVVCLCVRGIDVGNVFVCDGYRCWSCICV
jgi:hypothetical protein